MHRPSISQLNIAARVSRTEAEGPGVRYALWVQGCPMRCPGCCNPHLLEFTDAEWCEVEDEAKRIAATDGIEGVTFLGGEPFAQAAPLAELARRVRAAGLSVMVFSGYTLEQLRGEQRSDYDALLREIDLLIDGPFVESQRVTDRRWIGSANQRAHFLTDRYAHLRDKWEAHNTIELRLIDGQITINGYPHEDVADLLSSFVQRPPRPSPA